MDSKKVVVATTGKIMTVGGESKCVNCLGGFFSRFQKAKFGRHSREDSDSCRFKIGELSRRFEPHVLHVDVVDVRY